MKLKSILCALPLAFAATSAFALDVKVAKDSAAAPAAAWAAIGDWCGIASWHPAIEKCEESSKDGATFRTLTLKGGGTILEKQIAFDKAKMTYGYTIETSPLPIKNYSAVMTVTPKDKGSTIAWTAKFDAKDASDADAIKTITGIFEAGVDALVVKAGK